jgi:hypothetical protein
MNSKKIFSIFLGLSLSLLFFLFHEKSYAGLFGDNVPEVKEIKDPYLEQLFAPEFPYESIKVIETKEGKRYVIVRAKEKVSDKNRVDYEDKTLRNRGIVVFESGSPRTNILLISEMRLYRVVSQTPYVVEYSEARADSLERVPGVESVVRNQGKYLTIRINEDFGKVFKSIELYPEKEAMCPEPAFVGKYPSAKSISCIGGNKGISFLYVTKDEAEDIYNYYRDRLKAHYRNVGFNFPERSWEFNHEFGMEIDSCFAESCEVARIGKTIDFYKRKPPAEPQIPSNGVVFYIKITKIGLKPIVENFSFVEIYYCIDPEKIKMNIERMKKLHPEGVR